MIVKRAIDIYLEEGDPVPDASQLWQGYRIVRLDEIYDAHFVRIHKVDGQVIHLKNRDHPL